MLGKHTKLDPFTHAQGFLFHRLSSQRAVYPEVSQSILIFFCDYACAMEIRVRVVVLASCLLGTMANAHALSLEDSCSGIEADRNEQVNVANAEKLKDLATLYVRQCRPLRSKPEISIAMSEIAGVLRLQGSMQAALSQSQECIKFDYLSLNCHVEKALAMNGLGLKSEAREVLKTANNVLAQLGPVADHELLIANRIKNASKQNDYLMRLRSANARISILKNGGNYLKIAESSLGYIH